MVSDMNSLCHLLLLGLVVCLVPQFAASKHVICYKGQSYWCQNITTAVECNAVKHCIHSVWEKEVPIEKDPSPVCQTCIDMVKMAREQLESNETQEEIREVLEGTCQLIPEKHLRNECDKLMDDFGSYIVDTLSSEMNPSVVCSVAGLCYNKKFENSKVVRVLNCDNCNTLMKKVERNIDSASTSDLQRAMNKICESLGQFSEVCSSLVNDNMETVNVILRNNIKAGAVCDLSGVCAEKYHSHKERARSSKIPTDVQIFGMPSTEDLPCELCEQLVIHLRDVLIANTTEIEFKLVLEGLCNMSKLKKECTNYIDEYYTAIYHFLVDELDGKQLCTLIKICNATETTTHPIPVSAEPTQPQQLPLERMKITFMPTELTNIQQSPAACAFCEYFLHFVQQEVTLPSSEKEITKEMEHMCNKLPATVRGQCDSFVDTYMAQFVAIFANKIDPSQVCPSLGVCPGKLVAVQYTDKPTCPLCLLAMEEALKKVQNRSESSIHDVFDDLCMRDEFPTSVMLECVKFVQEFKAPATDMIIAEFTSQEACVYVDLCSPPRDNMVPLPKREPIALPHSGNIETNQIHESPEAGPLCVLCEFVMSKLAKLVDDKKTEEEIKQAIYGVCQYMPATVVPKCKEFVTEYGDEIFDFLIHEVSPKLVCASMTLCLPFEQHIRNPIEKCVVCEVFMDLLKTVMTNEEVDASLNSKMIKACSKFPVREVAFCQSMVEQLGPQIETILRTIPVGPLVCRRLNMCAKEQALDDLHLLRMDLGPGCFSGPEYWCASSANSVECDKIEYCQTNVWRSDKSAKSHLKGSVIY